MDKHILSKSTFVKGFQCHKALWLHRHHPELKDPVSPGLQAIFNRGIQVGILAHQLYPGGQFGVPVGEKPSVYWANHTRQLIQNGASIIYEACFVFNDVLCAIDMLVLDHGKWKAYEVKSSTSVTDTYKLDAAIQWYVINGSGLHLNDISIVHIKKYNRRLNKSNTSNLFQIKSVKRHVLKYTQIHEEVELLKQVALQNESPLISKGKHCKEPYRCEYFGFCSK